MAALPAGLPLTVQLYWVNVPVDVELNCTGVPSHKMGEFEKLTTGNGFTSIVCVAILLTVGHPCAEVTLSVMVYVPGVVYVWEGFCEVEKLPSPKFQFHCVIVEPDMVLWSVNDTALPTHTWAGLENAACGSA